MRARIALAGRQRRQYRAAAHAAGRRGAAGLRVEEAVRRALGAAVGRTARCAAPPAIARLTRPWASTTPIPDARLSGERGIHIRESSRSTRPPNSIYRFWRQLDRLPEVMPHLAKVEQLDTKRSRWTAKAFDQRADHVERGDHQRGAVRDRSAGRRCPARRFRTPARSRSSRCRATAAPKCACTCSTRRPAARPRAGWRNGRRGSGEADARRPARAQAPVRDQPSGLNPPVSPSFAGMLPATRPTNRIELRPLPP